MSSADYQTALGAATGVILADEFAPGLLGSAREVLAAIAAGKMPRLRRVIMISHIGVTRRWGSHLAPLSQRSFINNAALQSGVDIGVDRGCRHRVLTTQGAHTGCSHRVFTESVDRGR